MNDRSRQILAVISFRQLLIGIKCKRKKQQEKEERPAEENITRHGFSKSRSHCDLPVNVNDLQNVQDSPPHILDFGQF
jgi:hypothetical protein